MEPQWHCFLKAPRAESPRGDSQGPAEPSRALALPPCPPPAPSLPAHEHLRPGPSGASPAEQWGFSGPRPPACWRPPQWRHSPFLAGGDPLGPEHCARCGPASEGFPAGGSGARGRWSGLLIPSLRSSPASTAEEETQSWRDLLPVRLPVAGGTGSRAWVRGMPPVWTPGNPPSPCGPEV